MAGNYPAGVTDNDPHFDMPSVGDDEHLLDCDACGRLVPSNHLKTGFAYGLEGSFCRKCRRAEDEEDDA